MPWLNLLMLTAAPSPYAFDGAPSRAVLERYLDRSATVMALVGNEHRPDQIRFVLNTGIKFAGRAFIWWGSEAWHNQLIERAGPLIELFHRLDPELVFQGCIFEIVTTSVNDVPVPAWLLEEFGLPLESRNFRYQAMLYPDGQLVDHWSPGASVPDITRPETQLWFQYVARRYLDAGFEAIHLGQVELMGRSDPERRAWWQVIQRIRGYAADHARRRWVFLDAHTPRFGLSYDGDRLMLDAHAMPLRPAQIAERPHEAELRLGHLDTLYGRSRGGLSPAGYPVDALPYLVEFDNWGSSGRGGEVVNDWWVWGWDEIVWYAHQAPEYRHQWLQYAYDWLREHDPVGHLEMPAARCLADPIDGRSWYYANTPGPDLPEAFGDEEAIRAVWGTQAWNSRDGLRAQGDAGNPWSHAAGEAWFADTARDGIAVGQVALEPRARLRWTAPLTARVAVMVLAGGEVTLEQNGRPVPLELTPNRDRDDRAGRVVIDVAEGDALEFVAGAVRVSCLAVVRVE